MKNNIIVRTAISEAKIKQWQAAKILQVNECTFSRLLREELPEEKQKEIVDQIRKAVQ